MGDFTKDTSRQERRANAKRVNTERPEYKSGRSPTPYKRSDIKGYITRLNINWRRSHR